MCGGYVFEGDFDSLFVGSGVGGWFAFRIKMQCKKERVAKTVRFVECDKTAERKRGMLKHIAS